MINPSLTRNKTTIMKLPPLRISFSNLSPKKIYKSKLKPTNHNKQIHSMSNRHINFSSPTNYKSRNICNFRLRGMFSFSDKDKLDFKSKAEKYVDSLLSEDNCLSNENKTENTEKTISINTDNYAKLIDPLEIIKEKYLVTHYTDKMKEGENVKKKKDFNKIINNFSINSNKYRQVDPNSVFPRKDVLKNIKMEMKKSQNSLRPLLFGNNVQKYKEMRKVLNTDNSNYEETMFYLGQIFKSDFEHRVQNTIKMADNFLNEMNRRQEHTNKQKEMINQVG